MRISRLILSGALLLSLLPGGTALAASKDEIKEQINALEKQVEDINKSKDSLSDDLEGIQAEIAITNEKVAESEEKISAIENEIRSLTTIISNLNKEIDKKEEEILIKQIELDEKKELLGQTLSFLYENKDISFIEFFFQSGNLDEILNTFDFMKTIANENDNIYKEVQEQEKALNIQKDELQETKKDVENKLNETEDLKLVLDAEKNVLDALIQKQKAQEGFILDKIYEAERQADAAMAGIIASTKQLEEIAQQEEAKRKAEEEARRVAEQKKNSASAPTVTVPSTPAYSSALVRPMRAGTYTFTSPFGLRMHPIHNRNILHGGVDFAAPTGTPIYAAGSGKVIFAGPSPGFGNLIVILHSNNLYTLYAHMYPQHIYVSSGQNVSSGELIGGVGSAGDSTGPHLHFSVAEGRSGSGYNYVNPLNYISR